MSASMPRPDGGPFQPPKPPTRPADGAPLRMWVEYQLAVQAVACATLGSPLYAALLHRAAQDVASGGPVWQVLAPHAGRETDSALALRLMAAVHRMVLERQAPQLALVYPSVGGSGDLQAAWPAFRELLATQGEKVSRLVTLPCQTNEVGRCCALISGFLLAAHRSGLPLRLLEIGASAGLNLRWDHYRYEHDAGDARAWGPASSPVLLRGHWDIAAELVETAVEVAARAGCDPRPVDPTTPAGRTALTASVWADQTHRFERLRGALDVAARVPAEVVTAGAATWLPQQLAEPLPGTATVVYHSVVMQYLPSAERDAVRAILAEAGAAASLEAPLYWVRMEPEHPLRAMAVRLTAWPGGDERLLATAGAHGFPVRWRGDARE